jgi:hypothetical protein
MVKRLPAMEGASKREAQTFAVFSSIFFQDHRSLKTESWKLKRITTHIRDLGESDLPQARNSFSRQEYVR